MAIVKFNVKNVSFLGRLQVSEIVAVDPISTDAMAVIEASAEITRETEAYEYLGDSLSRDEFTVLKDDYAEVPIQTLMPVLGSLITGRLPVASPYFQWFTACGANITVDALGVVTCKNDVEVDRYLTIDYYKSSPEVSVPDTAKLQRFYGCRGTVDVTFEAGSRARLDFKYYGNANNPVMVPKVVPDVGTQVQDVASVVRLRNMQIATLSEVLGAQAAIDIVTIIGDGSEITVTFSEDINAVVSETIQIDGTVSFNGQFIVKTVTSARALTLISSINAAQETDGTGTKVKGKANTICINSGTFTNFFGFDYERFLMTCQEGFAKRAVPSDIVITILEDEVGGDSISPEENIEKFFELVIKWGTGDGNYVELRFDKIQLANTTDTEISTNFGKEVTFRNTGKSALIFS